MVDSRRNNESLIADMSTRIITHTSVSVTCPASDILPLTLIVSLTNSCCLEADNDVIIISAAVLAGQQAVINHPFTNPPSNK